MTEEIETDVNSISKAFNANAEEIIQTNSSKPVHSCCCFLYRKILQVVQKFRIPEDERKHT